MTYLFEGRGPRSGRGSLGVLLILRLLRAEVEHIGLLGCFVLPVSCGCWNSYLRRALLQACDFPKVLSTYCV